MKIKFHQTKGSWLISVWGGVALLLACGRAWGGPFADSYSVETLTPGTWEYVQWVTANEGKERGNYSDLMFRNEIKWGAAKNWEVGLMVMSQDVDAFHDLGNRTTGGMGVPATVGQAHPYSNYDFTWVAPEARYRWLDPKKAPIGVGFYFEPAMGPDEYELQTRILLQKDFLQGKLVWTGNIDWNWKWINNEVVWNQTMTFALTGGLSYHLAPQWWAGIEYRQDADFSSFATDSIQDFVFSAGPSIGYERKGWWVKGVVLAQLPVAEGLTASARSSEINGEIFTSAHSELEVEVKVGFRF